jgi:hypothetical protein
MCDIKNWKFKFLVKLLIFQKVFKIIFQGSFQIKLNLKLEWRQFHFKVIEHNA